MLLEDIQQILDSYEIEADLLLKKRLDELNREIKKLYLQQQIIVCMLKKRISPPNGPIMKKETLVKVLKNSGLGNAGLEKLHAEYERISPEEHQSFLELMGFSPEEIIKIRDCSKKTD